MDTFWDNYYNRPIDEVPWYKTQADWFMSLVDDGAVKGKSALDVGCGVGAKSIYLAQHGFEEVVGVDIAAQAIEHAKKNARDAALENTCTFFVHDASDLTFLPKEKQFDVVLDWATLHCIPEEKRAAYVNGITQRVKSDGILLLRTFSSGDGREYFEETIDGSSARVYLLTKAELETLYPQFEVVEEHMSAPRTKQDAVFLELLLKKTT